MQQYKAGSQYFTSVQAISKKRDFYDEGAPESSVLMKMSNCRHRVNYFCSQPWAIAEFLHQNYCTMEKFRQINYFLLNKVMNCTEEERHQQMLLLNWILYGPNRLNLSGWLWQTRRQHSQIQNKKCPLESCLYYFFPWVIWLFALKEKNMPNIQQHTLWSTALQRWLSGTGLWALIQLHPRGF